MKQRHNPVGLVITLIVTFAIAAGGIWWAYQYSVNGGGNTRTVVDNLQKPQIDRGNIETEDLPVNSPIDVSQQQDRNSSNQIIIKFRPQTPYLFPDSKQELFQFVEQVFAYDRQRTFIRIYTNLESSKTTNTLAQKRGQEIAGYLRDRGIKNRIVISRHPGEKNLDPNSMKIEILGQ